jgi:hypothetical protein
MEGIFGLTRARSQLSGTKLPALFGPKHLLYQYGPCPAGLWSDMEIFRDCLLNYLEDFERVETDDGYLGEAPLYVSCPAMIGFEEKQKKMTRRVNSQQETINKRFKQWEILNVPFRHDLLDHRNVFVAIECIK